LLVVFASRLKESLPRKHTEEIQYSATGNDYANDHDDMIIRRLPEGFDPAAKYAN